MRAYFPFHEDQLKKPNSLFHELTNTSQLLYTDLVHFAKSIANKDRIPDTLFESALFLELKDMVNEKKHDKLIAYVEESNQEYQIENEGFQIILPIKGQKGWTSFVACPGLKVTQVQEYRFQYNNTEVGKFCLFTHKATEFVITKLYMDHFA